MLHVLIGGAGFIGSNFAALLLSKGEQVVVLDNLYRRGAEHNLEWLKKAGAKNFRFEKLDITRDFESLKKEVEHADRVYHLAAQVAVTDSVANPRLDFEINALGSFNVCEAVRSAKTSPHLIYSSTNKVYGSLEKLKIKEGEKHYLLIDPPNGVSEETCIDFHSPYGCSKGCADQYVRDYNRIYKMKTTVFRQSCIYGPHQFGIEDQGWLAWLLIATKLGRQLSIYGDGKQVRDVLYVDDLFAAFEAAFSKPSASCGSIYNIGGGPSHTLSLLEYIDIMRSLGEKPQYSFANWRLGDQKVYISDIRKAKEELGWSPQISKLQGISKMKDWIGENMQLIAALNKG